MTTLHDTAEAIAALLGTGLAAGSFTFTTPVAPVVSYDTELELDELNVLDVMVVPAALSHVASSRSSLQYSVGVDIVVRHKFGPEDHDSRGKVKSTVVENYLGFLEELAEYLAMNPVPPTKTSACWTDNEIRNPWVPEHLRQNRQYTGIFRATYIVEVMLDGS